MRSPKRRIFRRRRPWWPLATVLTVVLAVSSSGYW